MRTPTSILFALALAAAWPALAQPAAPPRADDGSKASQLKVDRFAPGTGTRFLRAKVPNLPLANDPLDLDRPPFAVRVKGPDGVERTCYDLDVQPDNPGRYFIFYDANGAGILEQFPLIDRAPGDPSYSDFWLVYKIIVGDDFPRTNQLRSVARLEELLNNPQGGLKVESTKIMINAPVVPHGSTAALRADGRDGPATLRYAWYKGKRAAYLYFEGSIKNSEAKVPTATMTAPAGPGVPLDTGGPLTVTALPRTPGYSPLRRLTGKDGTPLAGGAINCPIVGPR